MRTVENRGTTNGAVQLVTPNGLSGHAPLKRGNNAADDDTFLTFSFPVPAVNPATNKPGHLYVAYADGGTNANDKSDIFFTSSTNSGTNWTSPLRVNTDATTNDQWMPVLCVKPDGTQLFMAWYDRRNDTNNSSIDLYGRFGTIATNGNVSFATEFRITTTNSPPVFAGTLSSNTNQGHYDPVYPPVGVNLHWWYSDWPDDPSFATFNNWIGHVGEYNGAYAEPSFVYVTWTDNRSLAMNTLFSRFQPDVRFIKLAWP